MQSHQLTKIEDIRAYVLGCGFQATFTLVSVKTGTRFTYRVRRVSKTGHPGTNPGYRNDFLFVDLLAGGDNISDYAFLGTARLIEPTKRWTFKHSAKSHVLSTWASVRGIRWFFERLYYDRSFEGVLEFWYSGHCSQCGRVLTVPESLERGMGPKCAARAAEVM